MAGTQRGRTPAEIVEEACTIGRTDPRQRREMLVGRAVLRGVALIERHGSACLPVLERLGRKPPPKEPSTHMAVWLLALARVRARVGRELPAILDKKIV